MSEWMNKAAHCTYKFDNTRYNSLSDIQRDTITLIMTQFKKINKQFD